MLRYALVFAVLAVANANAASLSKLRDPQGRIIGGEDAVIETYPYQVSLLNQKTHDCGGSIISANWIVTAGHCIPSIAKDLTVRAGSSYTDRNGSIHKVDRMIVHENYKLNNGEGVPIYDIALVHVVEPFIFDDTRQPIELFKVNETSRSGSWGVVTGWGNTGDIHYDGQLQSVAVPIITKKKCNNAYEPVGSRLPAGQICAGYLGEGGRDACQGDSGGPIAINGRLAGIVSWGYGCADPKYPGVYTEIAYFRDWIKKNAKV